MSIEALGAITAADTLAAAATTRSSVPQGSFGQWLAGQIKNVNSEVIQADQSVRELALGETENLHQVMVKLEKAKLSFELMLQVRNKVLEAYQDVIRMQI